MRQWWLLLWAVACRVDNGNGNDNDRERAHYPHPASWLMSHCLWVEWGQQQQWATDDMKGQWHHKTMTMGQQSQQDEDTMGQQHNGMTQWDNKTGCQDWKMTRLGIEPRTNWTYTRCSTNWAIRSYWDLYIVGIRGNLTWIASQPCSQYYNCLLEGVSSVSATNWHCHIYHVTDYIIQHRMTMRQWDGTMKRQRDEGTTGKGSQAPPPPSLQMQAGVVSHVLSDNHNHHPLPCYKCKQKGFSFFYILF